MGVNSLFSFVSVIFAMAIFIVGCIVLIRNYHSLIHRRFAFFAVSTAVWVAANSLSIITNTPSQALINEFYARLITPSSLATLYAFYRFSVVFPAGSAPDASRFEKIMLTGVLLISLCAFSDLNIQQYIEAGEIRYNFGLLYPFYIFVILGLAIQGLRILINKAKNLKGLYRIQVRTVFLGLILTIVPAMLTGVVLPLIGVNALWDYTHLFTIFFIVATAYSILKHKVFDLKLVTLRVLVYIMLVIFFGVGALLVLTSVSAGIGDYDINYRDIWAVITVTVLGLPFLSYVRRIFDKATRRIFYQGSYDLEEALEGISQNLVLLDNVESIVEAIKIKYQKTLSPTWLEVILFSKKDKPLFYGDLLSLSPKEIRYISKKTDRMLMTSRLAPGRLYTFLTKRDIEIVVTLHDTAKVVGFLLLGPKQAGRLYTDIDRKLLEISSNNLAVSLINALKFEQIQKFNKTLSRTVTLATRKLRDTNEHLKQLDRLKNDYISATSHQLKPQITAAKGFLEIMLDDKKVIISNQVRNNLNLTLKGIERMSRIVSGVLEPSLLDRDDLLLDKTTFDFCLLVKEELSTIAQQAKTKDIALETNMIKSVYIMADQEKCKEVVFNLLDNAVKYSSSGSSIIINTHIEKGELYFSVKDSGLGIKSGELNRVFDKYYRAYEVKKSHPAGTGIGLYVVKIFIEAHGGTVFVDSIVGDGSTFGFRLSI